MLALAMCTACAPSGATAALMGSGPTDEMLLIARKVEACAKSKLPSQAMECESWLLLSEPTCAKALTELASTLYYKRGYDAYPLHKMLNVCGKAYCSRLPKPLPALCKELPLEPNPSAWYDKAAPFLQAVDALEGISTIVTIYRTRSGHRYCRLPGAGTASVGGASPASDARPVGAGRAVASHGGRADRASHASRLRVTLRLSMEKGRLHVLGDDGASGSWLLARPWKQGMRPLVDGLYRQAPNAQIAVLVDGVVPMDAFKSLIAVMGAAGWCQLGLPRVPRSHPGGLSCPPAPGRKTKPASGLGKGSSEASILVTPSAMYYNGKLVLRLEDGMAPGDAITDGPQGHLIHLLRVKMLEDLRGPKPPEAFNVYAAPGMTLPMYTVSSISYSAYNALGQASSPRTQLPMSLSCR